MSKKAIAFIKIDGAQEITRYTQIRIEQHLFKHHEFSIQVPIESIEGEGHYTFNKSKALIGKVIHLSLKSDLIADVSSSPFTGIITDIGFVRSFGSSNELLIRGKSTTILLDNGNNYQSFSESSLSDIVNGIMEGYPKNLVNCTVDPNFTDNISYVVQYQESDFHFLQRIANHYGEWIYYNGSELIFGKAEMSDAIPLLLGRDLYDFKLSLALKPINYQTNYYDYLNSKVYHKASADAEVNNFDPAYGELSYHGSFELFKSSPAHPTKALTADQNELDKRLQTEVDQMSSHMVYVKGNSDHIGLGIGRTISVAGAKAEDASQGVENFGEFVLTQITHFIGGDGDYYNSFEAIPKEVGLPPSNSTIKLPFAEPEPAIVKENIDPDKLGRVRVQFYWQKDNEMTPWIRLVSTHAGAAGGFYVVPEKGDEVMVTYQHHHPDRPFVLGGVYNKESKPADNWSEPENNIKAIKTKSGNEIILNDKGGTEEIKILNKGGTNSIILTMSDGGSITISTPNQMTLSGKNINVNAEETFTLNAKNMIVNTEESVTISAGKQILTSSEAETIIAAKADAVVSSGANFAASAKSNAILAAETGEAAVSGKTGVAVVSEAGPVSVGALTNVDISADGMVGISGTAMTNVGSDGPVVVNGAIIQLN